MASVKSIGAGTTLEMGDGGGPEVFTAIAQIISIGELTRERPEVDATALDSLAREYVPGISTAPEFDIEMHMLLENATQDHLTGLAFIFNNSITRNFKLKPANETKVISFAGFVKAHTYGPFELEQTKKVKVRIKVTGAISVS